MEYILLILLFVSIELLYFKIAEACHIIDKPNTRSSHTAVTLRGGGIIFPIATFIAFFMGYVSWPLTAAVVLVGVVSFIDDMIPLPQLPRFLAHLIAVGLVFFELNLFYQPLWILPILLVLMIGWVNAFNFMDGINGITVLYAMAALLSFSFLPIHSAHLPLLLTMGLACIAFGIFNVRNKAKTFAGDVGSISMALFLGYFMIKTIFVTGQVGYILFFSVYGIDAVVTIVSRLMKKENIFQPHRSHLYQYLANEMGYYQIVVAFIYAVLQLIINGLVVFMDARGELSLSFVLMILVVLTLLYILIRSFVHRKMILRKS